MELWKTCMRFTDVTSPELASLIPHLLTLLQSATDVLPSVLKILEGYTLLDATMILRSCGEQIFLAFQILLGDLKIDAVKIVLHAFNLLIQSAPVNTWSQPLQASGVFSKLISPLFTQVCRSYS